ncbi:peptidylprolyl isomerase [Mucilaginibacter corticis]|uniref:peptidylprolyl isomerase n=1 Tax=Mucilaginibacter corticis TaxID=2597670 RepID=A0A556MV53_9SPHI|nr:FKBP-type peptidyl-prolyl cis-trans isomerase [Mucilaginibacter corticis]TSJ43824.1 peptidylprolyl isomerase [Mucilaginibacter corticis]
MKKYLLFILVAAFALKASAQDDFQRSPQGTQYKLLTHNTGDRIKVGDVVTFNVIQKTDKDSVLYSSFEAGKPAQRQVQQTGDPMMEVLQLMTVKDSAIIRIPTDSIFKDQEDKRPPFFPKGSNLLFIMKIEKVQSLAEAMADRDKAMAAEKEAVVKKQAEESGIIDKYVADNKLIVKTTPSGLKYKITQPSLKPKPLAGDTVFVNYVGRRLDGKVFDSSIETAAKEANLQQPGRVYEPIKFALGAQGVIPGWEEGLLLLNEGSKATFIIPSKLAYGERQSGPDLPPFSTLIFDVELVKVIRVKHAPTVAPSTTVKKTTTVKKSVTTKKKQ